MNTIPSPQNGDPAKEGTLPDGNQGSILPSEHEKNITDGGEFLDDAIRMKEQPLEETSIEEKSTNKISK